MSVLTPSSTTQSSMVLSSNTIKGLAMDAVQAANSGHPGAPMGMADMATVLWSRFLKYDPSKPDWADRDRVVLSNGHASMLLYAMLHLTGQGLTLDDLRNFRQWSSRTAGHPEHGFAPGIETTTGPLGQGFANAVGMAMAERMLAARFGAALVDHHTYVFCGDGCLMEGISAEAASFAGHNRLGRLIVLYDDNHITIDGSTAISFTEDVAARFQAYGWHTAHVDGHDHDAIASAISAARAEQDRPSLLCCRTIIGHGSPHLQGTSKTHGAPLGPAEVAATKLALGMDPNASFVVPAEVLAFFREHDGHRRLLREAWESRLQAHDQRAAWEAAVAAPDLTQVSWPSFDVGSKMATRKSSSTVIQALAAGLPSLVGGSADLAESNATHMKGAGDFSAANHAGRNINFGVREHAMASMCNGVSLHGGLIPFCATFLCFYDYMRPAVRLSAIMHQPVIYVYTHDSVFLGEDGPTHQPVEHLMAMRSTPNVHVFRPADATEAAAAWRYALARRTGPTAMALSRQNLPTLAGSSVEGAMSGAYVVADAKDAAVVLIGTGSEVSLAIEAAALLASEGVPARVVSMPCWEAFLARSAEDRATVLPAGLPRVSVEAGVSFGWERIVGDGAIVGIDRFGASAPGEIVAAKLGLTPVAVAFAAKALLNRGAARGATSI